MNKETAKAPEVENENVSLSWKNVRKASEIEALFRFIDEHSLRRESKIVFEALWSKLGPKKRSRRSSVKKVH